MSADDPLPDDFDPHDSEQAAYQMHDDSDDDQQEKGCGGNAKSTHGRPQRPAGEPAPELTNFPHERTSVYQRLIDFAVSLIAPPRNAGAPEMRRHAVALSVAVAMIYGYIAISWGALSSIGISGFAKADDLAALQDESAEVRVTLYGIAIRDLYRSCRNAADEQDRLALNGQLQAVKAKYEKAVGVPYLLPACVEGRQ